MFDGVGKDTFEQSLACLRKRGVCVLFGAASGQVLRAQCVHASQFFADLFSAGAHRPQPLDPGQPVPDATVAVSSLFGSCPVLGLFLPLPSHVIHPATRFDYIDAEGPCSIASLGAELFALMEAGKMQPKIGLTLPLASAGDAHDALQERRTTGKILLQVPP